MPSALPGELAWQHCELLGTHRHGRARLPDSFDITSIQHRFSSAIAAVCCFLLLASYFFYGWWGLRFFVLLICSTTVDFLIAQKISANNGDTIAKSGSSSHSYLIFRRLEFSNTLIFLRTRYQPR